MEQIKVWKKGKNEKKWGKLKREKMKRVRKMVKK